jgi:hypothetical protein
MGIVVDMVVTVVAIITITTTIMAAVIEADGLPLLSVD